MSNEYSLFDDLEQDNNPSLYGNASILTNPYNSGTSGNNNHTNYKSNNAEPKNALSVANGKKVESEGVVNTTSSAKRTLKKEKQQHNLVATSSSSPQLTPKQPHKHLPQQPLRQQLSPISNALSDNDEYPTELVNSTLGLSNQITQLLEASDLTIDVINSERLINSSIIVYTIQLQSSILQSKIVVKRRYSEFKSLRDNLLKLFPTLILSLIHI